MELHRIPYVGHTGSPVTGHAAGGKRETDGSSLGVAAFDKEVIDPRYHYIPIGICASGFRADVSNRRVAVRRVLLENSELRRNRVLWADGL